MTIRTFAVSVLTSCCLAGAAQAATIDFTNQGTFTTPSLAFAGGAVTGSADVNVLNFNGLGIVGGISNNVVDNNETINFAFTAPVVNVSYHVVSAGNGDGDGDVGDRLLEVFGLGGVSLGVFAQNGVGTTTLSDLVGAAIITRFSVMANGLDNFRISSISFDLAPQSEVPLPAALPLFLAGLAGFGAISRKRKRAA